MTENGNHNIPKFGHIANAVIREKFILSIPYMRKKGLKSIIEVCTL